MKRLLQIVLCLTLVLLCTAGCGKKKEAGSFEGTYSQLMDAMRTDLDTAGDQDVFASEPTSREAAADGKQPAAKILTYKMLADTDAEMDVYTLSKNDEVYQVTLRADMNALSRAQQEKLATVVDLLTQAFERKEREKLWEELHLPLTGDAIAAETAGTMASWSCTVEDGKLTLTATALAYLEYVEA